MNKTIAMAGGLLGGLGLAKAPLSMTFLAGIAPLTAVLGAASVVIFSAALIYQGLNELFRR